MIGEEGKKGKRVRGREGRFSIRHFTFSFVIADQDFLRDSYLPDDRHRNSSVANEKSEMENLLPWVMHNKKGNRLLPIPLLPCSP